MGTNAKGDTTTASSSAGQLHLSPQASSTRLFVRGLPPSFTESEFRSLFTARQYAITDAKFFPKRRFGYVGFKTNHDAAAARKWFDKSFVRMSKIAVEFAREFDTGALKTDRTPTREAVEHVAQNAKEAVQPRKRKRDEALGVEDFGVNTSTPSNINDTDKREKDVRTGKQTSAVDETTASSGQADNIPENISMQNEGTGAEQPRSDADWMRSRTSRLLGLVDESEDEQIEGVTGRESASPMVQIEESRPPLEAEASAQNMEAVEGAKSKEVATDDVIEKIRESKRLYLRNLPFTLDETEVEKYFSSIGPVSETHLPLDRKTGNGKGIGFVKFENADDAVEAYRKLDGVVFQGRLLHILHASAKREDKLDEFAISQLPLKKQKEIRRKAEASSSTFNWNSLYMNADTVASSVADRLGISKSELFDPSSSDAAVKQAQVETHVIQETKRFFEKHGVDLNSFNQRKRSETAILVTNFPYGTKAEDLKELFSKYGDIARVLFPPSGTIAIVEYSFKRQAQAAFSALAYTKIKDLPLYLKKAPEGVFKAPEKTSSSLQESSTGNSKISATELLEQGEGDDTLETGTLFIRNLNFATTNQRLVETFRSLDGFLSGQIKTKTDPKHQGKTLSMGFGFIEFRTSKQANAALQAMNGYNLDGHHLVLKLSHKGLDAAEAQRREEKAKKLKARKSKIVIKNLPFEATKNDVRTLFRTYGQLRAVRVPKKFDNSRKGFAFAEFATPKEAENAMDALRNTHLLGRRLVLDFAAGDVDDPEKEIEKMQQKVNKQSHSVRIQQLTSGRRKFVIGDEEGQEG